MSEHINIEMNKYIEDMIPDKVRNKYLDTVPGHLASLLDEIIYNVCEIGDDAPKNKEWTKKYLRVPPTVEDKLLLGKDKSDKVWSPMDTSWLEKEKVGHERSTKQVLREIHHYLEACAFKESL